MSVGLSITLKTFKSLNFVCSPSWNDRRWGYQWRIQGVRTPLLKTEKYKKNFSHIGKEKGQKLNSLQQHEQDPSLVQT